MKQFKVINWDFNRDTIEYYDIMPYFYREYEELSKDKKPSGFEETKKWILREAQYQFWARCQYEVIVTGWPQQKNEVKIDVFDQIEQNIDVITEIFLSNEN